MFEFPDQDLKSGEGRGGVQIGTATCSGLPEDPPRPLGGSSGGPLQAHLRNYGHRRAIGFDEEGGVTGVPQSFGKSNITFPDPAAEHEGALYEFNKMVHYMRFDNTSALVVDGNKNMQNIVRVMLHGFGIKQVHLAGDGAEALETLSHADIDVVICDLEMTPVDGIEFLKFVRWSSDSPAPRVPVIILSGQTEKAKIIAARDGGAHEFIAKPVSPKRLLERVESVLHKPREFVKAKDFKGPDRRRRSEASGGVERRSGRREGLIELD